MLRIKLGSDTLGIRSGLETVVLEDHSDLSDASFTLRKKNASGDVEYGIGSDIVVYGKTAEYVRAVLIDSADAPINEIKLEAYEDCCGNQRLFKGIVSHSSIDYEVTRDVNGWSCGCEIRITAEEDTDLSNRYDCLRNNLIKDPCRDNNRNPIPCPNSVFGNVSFQDYPHPFVRSCKCPQPTMLLNFLIIFLGGVSPLIYILIYLVAVPISAMTAILAEVVFWLSLRTCKECKEYSENTLNFGWVKDWLNAVDNLIADCGRGYLAPYARNFIQNVCEKCGLSFESSILNDPSSDYYNLALIYAQGGDEEERLEIADRKIYWDSSVPTDTGVGLLENLKTTFNAEWWIEGSVLKFEPKAVNQTVWLDFEEEADRLESPITLKFDKIRTPMYLDISYQSDAQCALSNKILKEYKDIVDYSLDSPNPRLMRGANKISIPFAPVRGADDGISGCGYYNPVTTAILYITLAVKAIIDINESKDKGYMLTSQNALFTPKAVVIDPSRSRIDLSEDAHAAIVRESHPDDPDKYYYNLPMILSDGKPVPGSSKVSWQPSTNLYRFFESLDPNRRGNLLKAQKFTLSFSYDCKILREMMTLITDSNFELYIRIPSCGSGYTIANVESIEITNRVLKLEGVV